MAAESPGSKRSGAPGRRNGWRRWLPVAGIALALLAFSEAVWLWQSWPVREFLRVEGTAR